MDTNGLYVTKEWGRVEDKQEEAGEGRKKIIRPGDKRGGPCAVKGVREKIKIVGGAMANNVGLSKMPLATQTQPSNFIAC